MDYSISGHIQFFGLKSKKIDLSICNRFFAIKETISNYMTFHHIYFLLGISCFGIIFAYFLNGLAQIKIFISSSKKENQAKENGWKRKNNIE